MLFNHIIVIGGTNLVVTFRFGISGVCFTGKYVGTRLSILVRPTTFLVDDLDK